MFSYSFTDSPTDEDFTQPPLYQNQEEDPEVAALMWKDRYGTTDDDDNEDDDQDNNSYKQTDSDQDDDDYDEEDYMSTIFKWYTLIYCIYLDVNLQNSDHNGQINRDGAALKSK